MTLPGPLGLRILGLGDLVDVESTNPSDGDILTYESASSTWKPVAAAAHSHALNDLSDLDAGTPSDDNVLYFDSADSKWKPGSISTLLSSLHLSDLDDVSANVPSEGDILCWDATAGEWYPTPAGEIEEMNLEDLADVTLTAPADNDILRYDSATAEWLNEPIVIALDEISDVDAAAPSDGDFLSWDSATSKWVPVASTTAGRPEGVYPEDYGAVGDGTTDDYAAFVAMFAALAATSAVRRKVILNPSVYYCIKTRTDATNVFLIDVDNLIMEGPGMGVKTIAYEGTDAATNFLHFTDQPGYNEIHDMKICGNSGDDVTTRSGSKITNIIMWEDGSASKYTSLSRLELVGCTGKAVSGFNWMSEIRHCLAKWCGTGFGPVTTTAFVANCYSNGCLIGYDIQGSYGVYLGCAADGAAADAGVNEIIGYKLSDINTFSLIGCGAEAVDQGINAFGYSLNIQGFHGTSTPVPSQPAFIEIGSSGGMMTGCYDNVSIKNTYFLQTTNCPNLVVGPWRPDGPIDRTRILETDTTDNLFRKPIYLRQDFWDQNSTISEYAPASFQKLIESDLPEYNGVQDASAKISDGTVTISATLILINMGGFGKFTIQRKDAAGNSDITFSQASGNAFEISNVHSPLYFYCPAGVDKRLYFKQTGTGVLFKFRNCQRVEFYKVTLDAAASSGAIFDLDKFTTLVLDKSTMDLITASVFSGLSNLPQSIKFTGYTDKPTAGIFDTGCVIEFEDTSSGYRGCVCTAGGEPGTWAYFGAVV
jgi:hypothetical protein